MWSALLALALPCAAHVHLIHTKYFSLPIRNAPAPSSDGAYSVAGPCGGTLTWGAQGFSTVVVGSNLSLVFAYNGGHQSATDNMLRVAMVCGRADSDVALKTTTVAPNFSPLVNASDSSTKGYDLWVIIPPINASVPNGEYCTISALDVRNWGGCVDVMLVTAPPPTPPPPNALTGKSLAGVYSFGTGQCVSDSLNCCCINGTVTLQHATGATSGNAAIEFASTAACNSTVSQSVPAQLLTQTAPNLASIKGTAVIGARNLGFQIEAGATGNRLVVTDDSATPSLCGINSALFVAAPVPIAPAGLGALSIGGSSGTNGIAGVILAVVTVVVAGGVMFFLGSRITDKCVALQERAVVLNVMMQVVLFVLSAASVGSPVWATGTDITLNLWRVCYPTSTMTVCENPADAITSGPLFRAVQAFAVLGLLGAINGMILYCVAVALKMGTKYLTALFALVVFEAICFFFVVCFFGGYYNDELSAALSLQWGYGLAILCWMLSVLILPLAHLPIKATGGETK